MEQAVAVESPPAAPCELVVLAVSVVGAVVGVVALAAGWISL